MSCLKFRLIFPDLDRQSKNPQNSTLFHKPYCMARYSVQWISIYRYIIAKWNYLDSRLWTSTTDERTHFLSFSKNVRQSCWTCSIDFGLDRKFSNLVQNHIMQDRSKRILGSGTFMITQIWILQRLKTSIMIIQVRVWV